MLEEEKNQAQKDKEMAEQRAEKAEKELKNLEQHREQLQPFMDSVNKELREVGTIELLLPEAGSLERAASYRDKKIKTIVYQDEK